jgi:protein-S-isoprenylcysteine O-methyltransferase Ste14
VLTSAAALQMMQARTTVIPHRQPQALVTGACSACRAIRSIWRMRAFCWRRSCGSTWSSPCRWSRLFVWLIQRRFILPEEARLRAGFGAAFDLWSTRVRRWI